MNLRDYLHANRVSPARLAKKLGISAGYISLLRNGKGLPSLPLALKIESETGGLVTPKDWSKEEGAR